ncbi:DUF6777 domain-containing protein, partial [Streptomyces sp. NPDC059909]|uniref:DUF6777 domain-containing protein n=1 Tax=Streptomyces sp. NPDC059909 TaxID=3346998 RepID=UPI0036658D87
MSASTAVVVALAVILAYTFVGGGKAEGVVVLQSTLSAGSDPFTPSTATKVESAVAHSTGPGASRADANRTGAVEVEGSHPGLYGGTQNAASCDVEKQITFLTQNSDKGSAFAAVLGIQSAEIPAYLRSLLPARLSWDTRVTNHGYKDNEATSYQAILQAGTPVLIDNRGVPRVRCACGNPLTPPAEVKGEQKFTGKQWSSFRPSGLVEIKPAEKPMKTVAMFDHDRKVWFERSTGDVQGRHDHEVPPPKGQIPGSSYPTLPPADDGSVDEESPGEEENEDEGSTDEEKEDQDKEKGKDEKKDEDKEDRDKEKGKDEKK